MIGGDRLHCKPAFSFPRWQHYTDLPIHYTSMLLATLFGSIDFVMYAIDVSWGSAGFKTMMYDVCREEMKGLKFVTHSVWLNIHNYIITK